MQKLMAKWENNVLWPYLFGNSYSTELFLLLLQSVYTLATIKAKETNTTSKVFVKQLIVLAKLRTNKK